MGFFDKLLVKVKRLPTPDEGNFMNEVPVDGNPIPDNDDRKAENQRPPEKTKLSVLEPKSVTPKPKPTRKRRSK